MVEKDKACKECGFLNQSSSRECESCGNKQFADKFKGRIAIFDAENSEVAKKAEISKNGRFAIKYG